MTESNTPPRLLLRLWYIVRDGLPAATRYRRYILLIVPSIVSIWALTFAYLLFAPVKYTSRMTLILPGSGVGGSLNLDSIGQASSTTSSAFSSASLSPTENYKRLLLADVTLRRAARIVRVPEDRFPDPTIKLIDQTNLIEIAITGPSPIAARRRNEALRLAFLKGLDGLRLDEAERREHADRIRINDLQEKVRAAQRRVISFQGTSGLVSLEQFNTRMGALDTLREREREARTTNKQQEATRARLAAALHISIEGARQAMLLKADPLFQSLLGRYAAVAVADAEAGATLGANHMTRQELDAQSAELRRQMVLRGQALSGLSPKTLLSFADLSVNEGRARMFESLVATDSQAAGSDAALGEIRRQITDQAHIERDLVRDAAKLADLVRDHRVAEAVFSSALARLDTNKSDPFASYPLVQTLEDPSLPKGKSSPSIAIALAGALGASILVLIGLGLSWLRQPILRKLLPKA